MTDERKRKRKGGESAATTWLTPFDHLHRAIRESPLAFARAGKTLAPLVQMHGQPEVETRFAIFLRSPDAKYGIEYFGRNFVDYAPPKPKGRPTTNLDAWEDAMRGHGGVKR